MVPGLTLKPVLIGKDCARNTAHIPDGRTDGRTKEHVPFCMNLDGTSFSIPGTVLIASEILTRARQHGSCLPVMVL